ncbi:hypothetical protein [Rhodopirellula sallentina]|uniref:Uncharacterized protein n=1 Tax=Rhodopirellula sallentina SM41 TaxID=1263870 RepID=M5UA52_9BACT|nr:hypothetical protein [Rhodopirellula sallentina]EMI54706.1 hypothetical protein RSSM_03822 [Rhodopirellula sallentina SM41]
MRVSRDTLTYWRGKLGRIAGGPCTCKKSEEETRILEETLSTYAAGTKRYATFDFPLFKDSVSKFVKSLKHTEQAFLYSASCNSPTMYSNAFAILTLAGLGVDLQPASSRWKESLDKYQCEEDGLFRDPCINNSLFEQNDWWGARHFALIATAAYDAIGSTPKYPFRFANAFTSESAVSQLIQDTDWSMNGDDDNKLMNVGGLLQYSRDRLQNTNAKNAVSLLLQLLIDRINPSTGLWGEADLDEPSERSRAVQFAYHLYCLLIYDNQKLPYPEPLIDSVLATQNELGGFAPRRNSSACEDIDSVHLLAAATRQTNYRSDEIKDALRHFLCWVFANQNTDGGFVFRRQDAFVYGHPQMSSRANESHLFATWFRCLSIALAFEATSPKTNPFHLHKSPGYYCGFSGGAHEC